MSTLPPASMDAVDIEIDLQLEILGLGTADVSLAGELVWMRGAPTANPPEACGIAVEVVALHAVGSAAPFGAITMTHERAGRGDGVLSSEGVSCVFPVSGFVELPVRLNVEALPTSLTTVTPLRLGIPTLGAFPPWFQTFSSDAEVGLRDAADPDAPVLASIAADLSLRTPHTVTVVLGEDAHLRGAGASPPPSIAPLQLALTETDQIDAVSFGRGTIDAPSRTRIAFSNDASESLLVSALSRDHETLADSTELGTVGSDIEALTVRELGVVDTEPNTIPDRPIFFSLAPGSPVLSALGAVAGDILVYDPAVGLGIFAFIDLDLGLTLADDVDALCLMKTALPIPFLRQGPVDVSSNFGAAHRNTQHDWALFSLAPGSPSLAALGATPADVLLTNFGAGIGGNTATMVYATADELGLQANDDVDALSCMRAASAVTIAGTAAQPGTAVANAGLPEDTGNPLAVRSVPGDYQFWKVVNPIDGHLDGPFGLPETPNPGVLHVGDPVNLPWDNLGLCGGFQLDDTKFGHAESEAQCGHGRFVSLVGPALDIAIGESPTAVASNLATAISEDPAMQRQGVAAYWREIDPPGRAALVVTGAGRTRFDVLAVGGDGLNLAPVSGVLPLPLIGEPDSDGDGVLDGSDNCPQHANANQEDGDDDAVGDLCDNCVLIPNPRLGSEGTPVREAFQTTTGGQLDDDADGAGNQCDAKFLPGGQVVGGTDLNEQLSAFNHDRADSDCGVTGDRPCAMFDLDNAGQFIGASDLGIAFQLFNTEPGPSCPSCPLECEGPAC